MSALTNTVGMQGKFRPRVFVDKELIQQDIGQKQCVNLPGADISIRLAMTRKSS